MLKVISSKSVIKKIRCAPRYWPCDVCGKKGKRKYKKLIKVKDAVYRTKAEIEATVGVYKSRCGCKKYFQSTAPELCKWKRYSSAVKEIVLDSLVKDRLTYKSVRDRLRRDFSIDMSIHTIDSIMRDEADGIDLGEKIPSLVTTKRVGGDVYRRAL